MDYATLLTRIDDFIRRFYLNKIIRGTIFLCVILIVSFLLLISLEYFEYFAVPVKTILFYSFIILQAALFWFLIGKHILHYFKLGAAIDHQQAAAIIGEHFPEIKDRLTNTLQLQQILSANPEKSALIKASINQRIHDFQPIPFVSAVKIRNNRKYLRFALFPLALMIVIALLAPAIFTDGALRFVKHDVYFEKKAPFEFHIENNQLQAVDGEDFSLRLRLSGKEIPQNIYLEDGKNSFKLKKESVLSFSHLFQNLQQTKVFQLRAGEFLSQEYTLNVVKKPLLLKVEAFLNYPKYLQRKSEVIRNPGDFAVPEGTSIQWNIQTRNTDVIEFELGNSSLQLVKDRTTFSAAIKALKTAEYSIVAKNNAKGDPLIHLLTVSPDSYPTINVDLRPDTVNPDILYFIGEVADDHGIQGISLHYTITKSSDEKRVNKSFRIPVKFNSARKDFADFFYLWTLKNNGIQAEEEMTYFFEVADNDGVNGSKITRSKTWHYQSPSVNERFDIAESKSERISDKVERAGSLSKEIQEDAKKLTLESLNSKSLDYNQQKLVEQLTDKQNRLENLLEEIKKENEQNLLQQKQLPNNQVIKDKQEQIQELFDNVLDDKTKALLENLQKLLNEKNSVSKPQNFQDIQVNNKALEKELDRILELYKKLEVEQKLNKNIQQLKNLSDKQRQAISKVNSSEQEAVNDEFQKIKQDLKEIAERDQSLENPTGFKNPEEQISQTENELRQALSNIKKGQQKNAQQSQNNAVQQMEKMVEHLEQMMPQETAEQTQVDERELRQLLKNLLQNSFNQESLMIELKNTNPSDNNIVEIGQRQRAIVDKLKIVEDSLYSLSKRVPQIASSVNKEISTINSQLTASLKNITERKVQEAGRQQQYALTSINNLALMLSDALKQLQNAMKRSGSGSGKGKPQPGLAALSQMQKELNENMQKAKQQLEKAGTQRGTDGQPGSKQFAEMARQQQIIREALRKLQQESDKGGSGSKNGLEKILKEMEQTETELVNKKISAEALLRQQNISVKLLEAEKAQRERENSQARESKTGKEFAPNYEEILKEYLNMKNKNLDMLNSRPPSLKSFYNSKISEYLKKLKLEE